MKSSIVPIRPQCAAKQLVALSLLVGGFNGLSLLSIACAQDQHQDQQSGSTSNESIRVVERFQQGQVRYVHAPKGLVKSGPSDGSYGTSTLSSGARVEVYMETSNGWSGIRPPDGSHNWIPAQSAFLLPGGKTAEIVEENTAAWIGSSDPIASEWKWQTALLKSQIVQVLGEQSQPSADGTKSLWYRIAPPQGEFRWIRTSQLSDAPSGLSEPSVAPSATAKKVADSQVKLASFSEQSNGPAGGSKVQQANAQSVDQEAGNGEMVWSNEADAIAEAERLIREEQSIAMQGAPDESVLVPDEQGIVPLESVEASMTPQQLVKAKRHQAAQHQVDSLKHWDALQSTDPKLRMKPLANVLGLVGFGIVEADRKPVRAQIATENHQFRQGNLRYDARMDSVGPSGYGRLDRLPRPGRGPRVRAPLGNDTFGEFSDNEPSRSESPYDENKPMLTRLWTADQPLFGGESGAPSNSDMGPAWSSREPNLGGPAIAAAPESEWHGIAPRIDRLEMAGDRAASSGEAQADFHTPEIQSAMLELTRIVSQPTERWELDRLRRQCEDWIERGDSSIVRGEARLLLDRLDRFDSLRTRTLGSMMDPSRIASSSSPRDVIPASAIAPSVPPAPPAQYPSVQFAGHATTPNGGGAAAGTAGTAAIGAGDASGWLVQVHGSLPGQPEYALTDDLGNVVTYVQSTAALNLRRYLQQPVVVRGQRGYIPSLAARQIVAESISRLR